MFTYQLACQLNDIIKKITHEYKRLINEMSEIDIQQQNVLHEIEFGCFNVVKGYFYAKKIKEIREKRRKIKMEFDSIQSLNVFY